MRQLTISAAAFALALSVPALGQSPATPRCGNEQPVTAATPYTIQLVRTTAVGERFRVRAEGSFDRLVTANQDGEQHVMQNATATVAFDAFAEVQAVDAEGRPTLVAYTVTECVLTVDGEVREIARDGSVMIAERTTGATTFEVDGFPVTGEEESAMQLVAALPTGGPTDDAVLGSAAPRTVGESWTIDVALAAQKLDALGAPVDPSAISGTTTFIEFKPYRGVDCQRVRTHFVLDGALPGLDELPPGMEMRSARVEATEEGMFPSDAALPAVARRAKTTVTASLVGAMGPGQAVVEITVRETREARLEFSPLDASGAVATVTEMP